VELKLNCQEVFLLYLFIFFTGVLCKLEGKSNDYEQTRTQYITKSGVELEDAGGGNDGLSVNQAVIWENSTVCTAGRTSFTTEPSLRLMLEHLLNLMESFSHSPMGSSAQRFPSKAGRV